MRQSARTAVVVAALVAAAGCGVTDGTPEASASDPGTETPDLASPAEASASVVPEPIDVTFGGTMPDGWTASGENSVPVPDSDTDTRFFEIHVNQAVMAADCTLGPEPDVGTRAYAIVDAIAERNGVRVSDRGFTTVDGLPAEWIDFAASEVTCPPDATEGYVPLFGSFDEDDNWLFTGAVPGETHRLIAVDLLGGPSPQMTDGPNVLIWTYALEPDMLADQLDEAMDVVWGLEIAGL